MVARNEITGDKIQSKINENDKFDKNYGEIDWSVKLEDTPVKPVEGVKNEDECNPN
jgi:hypothetical protein